MHNFRLLTLIFALVYVTIGVGSPLMTLYLEELGADYARISLILTCVAATALLSNYLWGRLSDKFGRRKPFLISALLAMTVTYTLLSRVPNAAWAWPILMINGAAMAAYTTPSLAMVGDLLAGHPNRGRRMGIYRGIASLTFAIGAVSGGRLADVTSISTALALCAAFYGVAALVALTLHETKPVQSATPGLVLTPSAIPREERVPNLFLAGVMLWVGGIGAAVSMWPNYMASLGYSKTAISSLWGLAALVEVPGMALVGSLSDLFGRAPLLAAGGLGVAVVLMGYVAFSRLLPALDWRADRAWLCLCQLHRQRHDFCRRVGQRTQPWQQQWPFQRRHRRGAVDGNAAWRYTGTGGWL